MLRVARTLALTSCATLCWAGGQAVADLKAMVSAEAWDLKYEVTFKASADSTDPREPGSVRTVVTLESSFSTSLSLDLRSGGPSLSMLKLSMAAPAGAPSAELQQEIMQLVLRTEDLANWVNGGPTATEDGDPDPEAYLNLGAATAKLAHTVEVTGTGLKDELGSKFDMHSLTTRNGTGKVNVATQLTFELDAKAGTFLLSLAHEFTDQTGALAKVETVERTHYVGEEPAENTKTRTETLQYPRQIVIDEPGVLLGYVVVIDGTVPPDAKVITGERTIQAHYVDNAWTIPGTLHVRYTLTPR